MVSYDITKSRIVVSSSFEPRVHRTDRFLTLKYWDRESFVRCVQSSCSAPTYFPAVPLVMADGHKAAMVDGGMIANNPEMIAVAEAIDRGVPLTDIRVLSIGTGKNVPNISFEKAQKMNGIEWIEHIIPELLCANESVSTYMANQVLDERYTYLTTNLVRSSLAIDDASDGNLVALEEDARRYVASPVVQQALDEWLGASERKTRDITARA